MQGEVCSKHLKKFFVIPLGQHRRTAPFLWPVFYADMRYRTAAATSLPAITQRRAEPKGSQGNRPGLSLGDHSDSEFAVTESVNVFTL